MSYQFILVTVQQGIARITLNRALKRNAMHGDMIAEITRALHDIANDDNARVVIINGDGEHFCAGADISWMQSIAQGSSQQNFADAESIADLMYQLYTFPKPTIVLAHGATMGGGLGLLAACDLAIAANNASFAFSEVKIGITPSTISPYVVAAIGERAARYYFLTGERFDAQTAHRIGLIHRVVEPDVLITTGNALATILLANSPNALHEAKKLLQYVSHEKISDQLAQKTAEHLANVRSTKEAQEGLKAFTEKRPPIWS